MAPIQTVGLVLHAPRKTVINRDSYGGRMLSLGLPENEVHVSSPRPPDTWRTAPIDVDVLAAPERRHEEVASLWGEGLGKCFVLGKIESPAPYYNLGTLQKDWRASRNVAGIKGCIEARVTFHDIRCAFATGALARQRVSVLPDAEHAGLTERLSRDRRQRAHGGDRQRRQGQVARRAAQATRPAAVRRDGPRHATLVPGNFFTLRLLGLGGAVAGDGPVVGGAALRAVGADAHVVGLAGLEALDGGGGGPSLDRLGRHDLAAPL